MKKPLLIYGAGGLGREVFSWIRTSEVWEPVGFVDDGIARNSLVKGLKVLGGTEILSTFADDIHLVFALGDPVLKAKLTRKVNHQHINYPVLVHPAAIVQDESSVRIRGGSIITAGAVVTTDIEIGEHVLINLNATVGHDTRIGSCSSIMPGVNIGGEVVIGESVMIGSGANILNRVHIGDGCIVGMGAVVIRNVTPGLTVAGVPAKSIQR